MPNLGLVSTMKANSYVAIIRKNKKKIMKWNV